MKKWICPVCGYVHEGNEPPEACPVCKVPGSRFTLQEGDMKLAAEHEYGVYAKTVENNPDISAEDFFIESRNFVNQLLIYSPLRVEYVIRKAPHLRSSCLTSVIRPILTSS